MAGEFDRRNRLHDPPGVNEILRHLEQLAGLEEEGSLLREEERLAWIERELAGVRFDLREIGFDRAVEIEVVGETPTHVAAHLRVAGVVAVAARAPCAGPSPCSLGGDVPSQPARPFAA